LLRDNSKPKSGDKKPNEKKPDEKKPEPREKKPGVRTPERVGTVKALAADGKSFTLQPAPTEKNKEPAPIEIQIRQGAKIMAGKEPGKLAVGQTVNLWFVKGSPNVAVEIQIGRLPEAPEKKLAPGDKGKKPEPKDGKIGKTVTITKGDLKVVFRDQAQSLSGATSLFHQKDAPEFAAFDDTGLNFEHIISGHKNPNNRFTPRQGKLTLVPLPSGKSAQLVRNKEDDRWAM